MTMGLRVLGLLGAAVLGGCSDVPRSAEFDVPAGQYAKAFDQTRDVLTSYRFSLERVDAGAGVIATDAKGTAGLATPWDGEQTTLEQSLDDLVNKQQRTVRVTFETTPAQADLRQASGPVHGHVDVYIERTCRPGWQLDATSLRLSLFTEDPALVDRGMWPRYDVPTEQDPLLAGRIAAAVRRRLGIAEPGATPATRPPASPSPKGAGEPGR
jgi:hypothetical protein